MIAVDTNILVYAHREDSPHHAVAARALRGLAEGSASWAIPWPCVHEFLAVVTHPRIYLPPTPMDVALAAVRTLAELPGLRLLHESAGHAEELRRLLERGDVVGPRVHDARIAAICLSHGVTELWSADRDFSWFPQLRTVNPLVR
ncbi:toxin-antitoxin system PIN domain toxin [Microbacterium sp. W4I4]|uniref:type II toxin-antitoxin system VapC family toxin n=1 Tax=Microbacterium sp. W4I4 TaxID=3042295 RepID=UPI00277EE23C|nr:TA system VapC family ribonuclease toxin [Microbacterium sp. W4I4]MDQ0614859.1 toxin-antitoxin system PIN domain toxin [Microbacterium sp. W4I4]